MTSNNHLKMYGNLGLMIVASIAIYYMCKDSPIIISLLCLGLLLFFYIFIQCLIPYKNPNASKSKRYKLGVRVSFILIVILFVLAFLGDASLMDLVK